LAPRGSSAEGGLVVVGEDVDTDKEGDPIRFDSRVGDVEMVGRDVGNYHFMADWFRKKVQQS
jgi:hypothetical protein